MSYQTEEDVRNRLLFWHDTMGMTWREIATLPDYNGISYATLNGIANGRVVKDEWIRLRLGMEPDPAYLHWSKFEEFRKHATWKPKRWDQHTKKQIRLAFKYREEIT